VSNGPVQRGRSAQTTTPTQGTWKHPGNHSVQWGAKVSRWPVLSFTAALKFSSLDTGQSPLLTNFWVKTSVLKNLCRSAGLASMKHSIFAMEYHKCPVSVIANCQTHLSFLWERGAVSSCSGFHWATATL
jgi:hypothetical protein